MNCINNYLEECKKDKKDPFENNDMEKRKHFMAFGIKMQRRYVGVWTS